MGLYSEPRSMTGSAGRMCTDQSRTAAQPSGIDALKVHDVQAGPPRAGDALSSKVCRRCGCATDTAHAEPSDCIDALRETIAEIWAGEVRRHGRGPAKKAGG